MLKPTAVLLALTIAGCQTTQQALSDPQMLAQRCEELDLGVLALELLASKKHQATIRVARTTVDTICTKPPTDYREALIAIATVLVKVKAARSYEGI